MSILFCATYCTLSIFIVLTNSYGHPTEGVLSRLRDVGAQVFRTDMQGGVVFVSDGGALSFGTEKYADAQMLWKSGGATN